MQITKHIEMKPSCNFSHFREVEELQAASCFPDDIFRSEQGCIRQPVIHQLEFAIGLATLMGMIIAFEADQLDILVVLQAAVPVRPKG